MEDWNMSTFKQNLVTDIKENVNAVTNLVKMTTYWFYHKPVTYTGICVLAFFIGKVTGAKKGTFKENAIIEFKAMRVGLGNFIGAYKHDFHTRPIISSVRFTLSVCIGMALAQVLAERKNEKMKVRNQKTAA